MLVITKHIGQLCNQFWSLLPIIAYAEHTHTKVCIFNARKDYICLFPSLRKYNRIKWIHLCENGAGHVWQRITRVIEKIIHPFEGLLDTNTSYGVRQINGWEYSHEKSYIDEQKQFLLRLFTPKDDVLQKSRNVLREYNGITIGVHIRRGDYKDWCGGMYYYSDEEYLRIMSMLAKEAEQRGKNIRFLICSNEPFDTTQTKLSLFQIPDTDGITDLYGLAQCDYIFGPPSTYSQWASFYGDVPLCLILHAEQNVTFKHFSSIVSLDTFANGSRLQMDETTGRFSIK